MLWAVDNDGRSKGEKKATKETLTSFIDCNLWHQLTVVELLPAGNESLQSRRVGVAIDVDQEGRGHEVGRLLCLLIQNKVVGITDQWAVVCVKVHLMRNLDKKRIQLCRLNFIQITSYTV